MLPYSGSEICANVALLSRVKWSKASIRHLYVYHRVFSTSITFKNVLPFLVTGYVIQKLCRKFTSSLFIIQGRTGGAHFFSRPVGNRRNSRPYPGADWTRGLCIAEQRLLLSLRRYQIISLLLGVRGTVCTNKLSEVVTRSRTRNLKIRDQVCNR